MNRLLAMITCAAAIAVGGLGMIPDEIAAAPKVKGPGGKKAVAKKVSQSGTVSPSATIGGFPEWVSSVAISPKEGTIAVGSYGEIRLYDSTGKKPLGTLKVKSGYVRGLAFSPDGSRLAAGSYRSLDVFSTSNQKPLQALAGHRGQITGLAYSPNGKQLASACDDEKIRLWDDSGKLLGTLEGHGYPVQGVAWSPDGSLLASAAGDETRVTKKGEVKLWNVVEMKEVRSFPEPDRVATGVAISPDGKFVVATSQDEKVYVYDAASGKAVGFFGGHKRPTNAVLFARGETLVSGAGGRAAGGNDIMVWNRADGDKLGQLMGHKGRITSLAISADGATLVSGSYDKTAAVWDLKAVFAKSAAATTQLAAVEKPGAKASAAKTAKPNAKKSAKADAKKSAAKNPAATKMLRIGIIGLDTSHATAFTNTINDEKAGPEFANCRIVAAYPKGSPDIPSSVSRVPGYTEAVKKKGVKIVDSIEELLTQVDCVLLETNDGRPHLEQLLPCLKAGKPTFIDKPIAASLADAVAIFEASRKYKTPVFSSSALRYAKGAQAIRAGSIGKVTYCLAYSPCSLEKTHPDLFWYGIHGVEELFTVMKTGCESVQRTVSNADMDEVKGTWSGGRIGVFQGYRKGGKGYGGTAKGVKGTAELGGYAGYRPLAVEFVKFFRTGKPPVSEEETLEIYAFMEAADESKRQGGKVVTLESVMTKARADAKKRLAELDK